MGTENQNLKSYPVPHTPHPGLIPSWLLAGGLLLAGCGSAFAPWVWRESVALQLTGPGLAEFVKFLPEVRTAQLHFERLHFLYPLFWASLAIPLLVENRRLALPRWLRWPLRLAVIPLALAALSPVWTPAILVAPEFRVQTLLALLAIGLAIIAPLLKGLPLRVGVIFLVGGGLAAVWLPWHTFGLVQASISAVYDQLVSLGWGWWLTVAGVGLSLVGGIWAALAAGVRRGR